MEHDEAPPIEADMVDHRRVYLHDHGWQEGIREERERCAKIADGLVGSSTGTMLEGMRSAVAESIAAAIRKEPAHG